MLKHVEWVTEKEKVKKEHTHCILQTHTFHFRSRTVRQKFLIQNSYHVLPKCKTGALPVFSHINLSRFCTASCHMIGLCIGEKIWRQWNQTRHCLSRLSMGFFGRPTAPGSLLARECSSGSHVSLLILWKSTAEMHALTSQLTNQMTKIATCTFDFNVRYRMPHPYNGSERNYCFKLRVSQKRRIFPLTSASRPALGPTQPPVQWVAGIFPGDKCGRSVMLTAHPPSSAVG
jgi:hypothetical protein